jgi:predicted transposase YbfD/YdcC
MTPTTLSEIFEDFKDPRMERAQRHSLINIITIAICAVICGADNFVTMAEFGRSKKKWFESFLDMPNGVPSHDTFNDVINRLDSCAFVNYFTQWIKQLALNDETVIAIDGKVLRRTLDKINGGKAVWLVNVWSVANNMCFGQVQVDEKSNEITAIPKLLKLLDIKGATITIDAMGCQTKIAQNIIEQGGDFVLSLKGNQGELHDDIRVFLDALIEAPSTLTPYDKHETVDGDHGRIETRTIWLTSEIDWLIERHPRWSSINAIAVIQSQRLIDGNLSIERRYYITSHKDKDGEFIGNVIRNHWFVENKLHWHLDVSFDEDQCRLRSGNAAANFSFLNKIALNLLKNEKTAKIGVKSKRLKAGWDEKYLMKVLTVGL